MKTTKGELKLILKECLRELIAEGALSGPTNQYHQNPTVNPNIASRAQMIAQQASGGNAQQAKILESVLMDSAQESEAFEQGLVPPSQQTKLIQERQQLQSFGGGSMGRWAALAFNTQPRSLPVMPM